VCSDHHLTLAIGALLVGALGLLTLYWALFAAFGTGEMLEATPNSPPCQTAECAECQPHEIRKNHRNLFRAKILPLDGGWAAAFC